MHTPLSDYLDTSNLHLLTFKQCHAHVRLHGHIIDLLHGVLAVIGLLSSGLQQLPADC